MNWFKENPVPAGILGAGLALALVGAWLAFQASSREAAAKETLVNETARIQRLERRQPPPNDEGLQKAKTALLEYEAELNKLAATLAAKEEPLVEISPEDFQDEIRKAANAVASKAQSKNVVLPENFLLGFEAFQSQLPPPDQTAVLYREFKVVDRLINAILDLGIEQIDLLERGRAKADQEDSESAEPEPQQAAKSDEPQTPALAVHPFRLAFTAKQDVLLNALNLIPAESQFLVIRSLLLENTSPEPPSRLAATDQSASPAAAIDALLPGETPEQKLDVILGRESVKATLELELLDFPETSAAQNPPPAN